ncbi:WGR domain-containing protein [Pararhizobium sp. O133]|uniref:WGR domain-containing protein n=1 Tax=Pararhizobium sp. O133 TaxID=3449278 RepID=UPI003F682A64
MLIILAEPTLTTNFSATETITIVNQSATIDSYLSLDGARVPRQIRRMITPYRIYIERKDAARGMARFYALSIETNLFGEMTLVRRWGRIGTGGRQRVRTHDREHDAVREFLMLLGVKRRRGYLPVVKTGDQA